MNNKLDKNEFYRQIKRYCNPFLKQTPINICMKINEESKYKIILEEFWITTEKNRGNDFALKIVDTTKEGYERQVGDEIKFNLDEENIYTDFQCYKFINKKIKELLEQRNGKQM